ncbi:MAG: hypothetical protein IPP65_09785 [Chlorobi bacterium]|nr:hypothetical protein [Chlorobiota bacterium]
MIDKLSSSNSKFKIIALSDQLLNPVAKYENYSTYPEERQKIIDLILNEGIKGVVFFSGDRHITELSKLDRIGTYPLYD